jgi:hypothetical protein
MSDALYLAWYRTRATFDKCWPGYISIVVLVGLVAGFFARDINAVPQPAVPVLEVVLIAAGALLVATSWPPFPAALRRAHP